MICNRRLLQLRQEYFTFLDDRGRQNLTTAEANLTAKELLDKSHELKSARSKNTKDFYRYWRSL